MNNIISTSDFHGSRSSVVWFWFAVFLLLIVAAHIIALVQWTFYPNQTVNGVQISHQYPYYEVIFTILTCILVVTPAICFHIFPRSDARNNHWRAAWTFAYLAVLVHRAWAIFGIFSGDVGQTFHAAAAAKLSDDRLVEHPYLDYFLTAWGGLNVILAWSMSDDIKWFAYSEAQSTCWRSSCFGAFVLADKAEIGARLLGILMAILVLSCLFIRFVVSENDPKSLMMVLYVKFSAQCGLPADALWCLERWGVDALVVSGSAAVSASPGRRRAGCIHNNSERTACAPAIQPATTVWEASNYE
jgi:hypothetical protein